MENLEAIIRQLEIWANNNKVSIQCELKSIDKKIKKFYTNNSLTTKVSSTLPPKNKKPLSPPKVGNKKTQPKSDEKINFKIKKLTLPVKGICHFCTSMSQDVYKTENNKNIIACTKCVKKKRKINNKKGNTEYIDAMSRLVPGCYGSGKSSR